MATTKKYWKSTAQLDESNEIVKNLEQNEFAAPIPTEEFLGNNEVMEESSTTRRDFLKYVGFSTAAASLAACEGPVIYSVPYVNQPEQIIPGMANYYATTIADGYDFASILVKTREGRPIKIESNKDAKYRGHANARVHASVLSLYDNNRLKTPLVKGAESTWETLDKEVAQKLNELNGKTLAVLTQTFASPSTMAIIEMLKSKYSNVRHVTYDTVGEDGALNAFESKYGVRGLADYDFTDAETIVSIGADFVGNWQGGGFDKGYSASRVPSNKSMSHHVQFESNMTLSGANADLRYPVTPTEQKHILAALYSKLVGGAANVSLSDKVAKVVEQTAQKLSKAGSKAVVLCGLPDQAAQQLVLAINEKLNSSIVDTAAPIMTRQGNRLAVDQLVKEMQSGSVGALFVAGVDPIYSYDNSDAFAKAMEKVALTVSFASREDSTAQKCDYVATTPHYLESWGDTEIKKGIVSLAQPTIRPIFDTRQLQDTLLKWSGSDQSYKDYLKLYSKSNGASWSQALQDGFFTSNVGLQVDENASEFVASVSDNSALSQLVNSKKPSGFELILYTKTGLGDGAQANNPWLQELPDPITRTTWDNYVTISQIDAEQLGVENENVANGGLNGSYVVVKMNGVERKLPALIQPGQAQGTIGIALGYGKTASIQAEMQTGVNAYPFFKSGSSIQAVTVENVGGEHEFACTQLQNTMMGRDIIRETDLTTYINGDKHEFNPMPEVSLNHIETPVTSPDVDLWTSFDRSTGHHFNMSIDLNACTGCGACVIACHAENNVPVVGKQEVRKSRDMHWLRIDRYYSSTDSFESDEDKKDGFEGLFGDNGSLGGFGELENPADNPQVAFQPVMCQHCNHAPCETVCPVAASSHGRQGQNHMAYNRCVGTRYCANNCPYKVRRFNWFLYNGNDEFDYHMNNDLGRMVINPDVTVRSRGVMEKCSMCMQMTQMTILEAKKDGRMIKDGEFATACSNACSNGAIKFGDINDKESEITKLKNSDRMYHLLEEVGTEPNVIYQVKVRNA
ncbi:TAT-variant-translocated molybdopterin oxidoreductase [Nonlabens ulvanivorans]|uniref:Quinol:cytochrome C oxidoreductase n=1 Tax=Nonlabens ulvanivorans TaxID=906888 RepID=A0A084JUU2_NONUL|nr:TAT-variant-translocated molybdopterin oxidoreductase [Nonlabens ulvanivorans]KEZ92726.1 quinol:cytochrome C oxidoreductase [Nonlabens ulvanivorans]PRX15571.1 quinol:cytochrome c oxidoreductase iron-sulfur protein precursor [Nonlabens ulvanivorans]